MVTAAPAVIGLRQQQQVDLIQVNGAVPALFDTHTGGIQLTAGLSAFGPVVAAEVQATGTLYTVPAGQTFTGVLALLVGGPSTGSITITAATGGLQLSVSGPGTAVSRWVVVPVTIAGGGGGNALTVAAVSGGNLLSAVLAGYL